MNDTIIFFVLAGIALIFKWLNRERSNDAEDPTPPSQSSPNELPRRTPVTRSPAQSEEEKVRRFLEALGAPAGSAPPPPVRRQATAPRRIVTPTRKTPPKVRRSWAQPLPPLVTRPEEQSSLPPFTTAPNLPDQPPVIAAPAPLPPLLPSSVSIVRQPSLQPGAPRRQSSLGEMLRTPGSARRAIILREVLGPPRGLQRLDEPRAF